MIGAASGAAIGAIADKENRGRGAAIGAGVGVLAGGAVGAYMDYQEKKLREKLAGTGVSVKRVGDDIYLNMPGNLTFATDHAEIRADFYDVLNSVVLVLNEYNKTLIEITGHTDSTGSDAHNQQLSEARAHSVAAYFHSHDVVPERLIT
ncbi:MAG: cell envelope biogenesis protein OmpA, partial [Deltaproteobacteria bacterium]